MNCPHCGSDSHESDGRSDHCWRHVHAKIAKLQAENARLTEERDHWKQARESAMVAGEMLTAENARLREALTRFDQLVEAAQTSHADDGYTDADVQVGKFQDELALLALAATDQVVA